MTACDEITTNKTKKHDVKLLTVNQNTNKQTEITALGSPVVPEV